MKSFALMSLFLAIPLPAQTATPTPTVPACPVTILEVQPNGSGWDTFGAAMADKNHPRRTPPFRLKIQNESGKDIKGIKFGAAYYDSVEDPHVIPVDWGLYNLVKAGKEAKGIWDNSIWHDTANIGWIVWPQKILFTDGTRWEISEASIGCSKIYWKDGMDHHITVKPSILNRAQETTSRR